MTATTLLTDADGLPLLICPWCGHVEALVDCDGMGLMEDEDAGKLFCARCQRAFEIPEATVEEST